MSSSLLLFNILNQPVLFFFLAIRAIFLKSDLEIPQTFPNSFVFQHHQFSRNLVVEAVKKIEIITNS
jgi:hypothetical protein